MTQAPSFPPELLQAFEAVPDLYLILLPDFTILTASDAYLNVTGKVRESIQGKSVFDVFPDNPALPDSEATTTLRHSLEWVLQHKQPNQKGFLRYDIPLAEQPGTFVEKYWSITNTPVPDKEGNIRYIIHKGEDITEKVVTQRRIAHSQQQLEQLSEQQTITKAALVSARTEADLQRQKLYNILMQAPALVCIFEGPHHVFKLVNPPYQQLVGDRPLLGKPIAEAMPELAGQPVFELLDRVYRTGESYHAQEMKVQLDHENTGNLGHNHYNFIYKATRGLDGNIDGIMVFAYEVTAQVEARQKMEQREQALQALNEQLAAANEEIRAANEQLSETQLALQDLNRQLEERVIARTRELKLSKAETEAQRNRLQQLFMEAPAPIVILDGPELVYELVNPAYQQIFPGRALLGKPLLQALPELEGSPIPEILDKVYKTGETFVALELPLMLSRHQDAPPEEIYWTFTYQARRNEEGVVDGVLVFAHEVTEQVRERQVVEQGAERLQLITDTLPAAITYLDRDQRYRFANLLAQQWRGGNILGKTMEEVMHKDAFEVVQPYIKRVLQGERVRFNKQLSYADSKRHVLTDFIPHLENGVVKGFYSLITDINDQVEARQRAEESEKEAQGLANQLAATNEELTTANKQLVRTNIDLDNFIYAASHDLKAPIFNIEGLMQILIDTLPPQLLASGNVEAVINMIKDSIERFKRTIGHLTEVTKLQKENNQETVQVNIQTVIQDIRLDLSPQLTAAGAQLEIDVATCPDIHFSEKNLRSVIYNLLSNAVHYRSPERSPHIRISCRPEGEYVILSVQDNGLGMDLHNEKKLFTMFGRLHDHVEGSGVGLYMVKKIVENADGRIEVKSKVGVGSTFSVYFRK